MKLAKVKIYLATVAHHLGGWRLDSRINHRYYLLGEGMKICVYTKSYPQAAKGRLFLSGCLPCGYSGTPQTQNISISPTRKPLAVALDIRRRLLNDFRMELKTANEQLTRHRDNEIKRQHLMHLITNVDFSNEWINDYRGFGSLNLSVFFNSGVVGTFKVYPNRNSDLSITGLSPEQIIKLAYYLKEAE